MYGIGPTSLRYMSVSKYRIHNIFLKLLACRRKTCGEFSFAQALEYQIGKHFDIAVYSAVHVSLVYPRIVGWAEV